MVKFYEAGLKRVFLFLSAFITRPLKGEAGLINIRRIAQE